MQYTNVDSVLHSSFLVSERLENFFMPKAKIIRLRTSSEAIRAEKAQELRRLVRGTPEVPKWLADQLVSVVDHAAAERNGWTFVMLGPSQNRFVVHWLSKNANSPLQALRLWACCFENLDMDTGEILMSRPQLAEAAGITPQQVSRVFGELVQLGALIRDVGIDAGGDRRSRFRYRMNSYVGTRLADGPRQAQQARDPQIRPV